MLSSLDGMDNSTTPFELGTSDYLYKSALL